MVLYQFHSNSNGDARGVVLLAYFLYAMAITWQAVGWDPLLWAQVVLYVVAFTCAKFVDDAGMKREPHVSWLPHHKEGTWGLHEDFHILLLAADIVSGVLAGKYHYPRVEMLANIRP